MTTHANVYYQTHNCAKKNKLGKGEAVVREGVKGRWLKG